MQANPQKEDTDQNFSEKQQQQNKVKLSFWNYYPLGAQ